MLLEGLLGVSSSTIFKGKGYIQLETEDDIDKVYEPGVYAIKGTSYNDQTLLVSVTIWDSQQYNLELITMVVF